MASEDPLRLPEVLALIQQAFLEGYEEGCAETPGCDHGVRWWEWVAYAVSLVVMAGSIWLILNHPGWAVQ